MAKRKNGEGSIVQFKDGTYKVRLMYKTPDGRTKDRQKRAKTLAEAEAYLEKFRREAEQANRVSTSGIDNVTLQQYVEELFLPWKMKYLKPQSYRRVESIFTHHIFAKHGDVAMVKLTGGQIEEFLEELHADGLSHSTVKKVHDGYKSLYKFAVNVKKDIHPEDDPTTGVRMIPEKYFVKNDIKWLTAEEICAFANEATRKFKTGAPVYKYGSVFLFTLNTGLREGELRALHKEDIDLKNRVIYIGKSVNVVAEKRDNGSNAYHKELTTPKTRNSIRYVPLNDEAVKYAEKILADFPSGELFIYSNAGKLVDSGTLYKQFKSIMRNAGLDERGIHTLRHTFVSVMYKNGIDVMTIAEIIGDTPETVRKTYLHIDKSTKMQAVQTVNIVSSSVDVDTVVDNVIDFNVTRKMVG